jgi:hypothetical protein
LAFILVCWLDEQLSINIKTDSRLGQDDINQPMLMQQQEEAQV